MGQDCRRGGVPRDLVNIQASFSPKSRPVYHHDQEIRKGTETRMGEQGASKNLEQKKEMYVL